jgi:hypothetical protein
MPKYTHYKLDVFVKKDAKRIKKENPELKITTIQNTLSTFLGYRNFQELLKRDLNKETIEISGLLHQKHYDLCLEYTNNVKNKYSLSYYFTNLETSLPTLKVIAENSTHFISDEIIIDFTEYKKVLKLTNDNFLNILNFYIDEQVRNKSDNNILIILRKHIDLTFELMKHNGIINFQDEYQNENGFQKWFYFFLSDNEIDGRYSISDVNLKNRVKELITLTKKSNYISNVLMYDLIEIIESPFFNMSILNKETICFNEIMGKKHIRIVFLAVNLLSNSLELEFLSKMHTF